MSENSGGSRTDVWGVGTAPAPCSNTPSLQGYIPRSFWRRDALRTGTEASPPNQGQTPPLKGAAGREEQSLQVYSLFIKGGAHTIMNDIYK